MNGVFIIIGGNLGNRQKNISNCLLEIEDNIGVIIKKSKIYETEAWGNENQPHFLNQVILIETELDAHDVLQKALNIELKMGRTRTQKWTERIIDIDILYFNEDVIEKQGLSVPHPFIQDRKFVLVPLAEIAPNFVHPIFQKTQLELLCECKDTLEVHEAKTNNSI